MEREKKFSKASPPLLFSQIAPFLFLLFPLLSLLHQVSKAHLETLAFYAALFKKTFLSVASRVFRCKDAFCVNGPLTARLRTLTVSIATGTSNCSDAMTLPFSAWLFYS